MIEILAALLTPTVAIAAAIIAWRQSRIAQQKLVLDLFEKRFTLYGNAMKIVRAITGAGKATNENLIAFWRVQGEAQFLFGPDVGRYLADVEDEISRNVVYWAEMEGLPRGPERSEGVKEARGTMEIIAEFQRRFPTVVAPYMKMHGRSPRSFGEIFAEANARRLAAGE